VILSDLAKYSMTRSNSRPLCDSRATCCLRSYVINECRLHTLRTVFKAIRLLHALIARGP